MTERKYVLDPQPRMIPNEITADELVALKRFLHSRTWTILSTIFANAATCAALTQDHAQANAYNACASFDVDSLEDLMDKGAFNAPQLMKDETRMEPDMWIDPMRRTP